jgi:hypothetical protein
MKRRLPNWCIQRAMFHGYMIVATVRETQNILGIDYKKGQDVYLCTRKSFIGGTHWEVDVETACLRGGFFINTLHTQIALEDWSKFLFKDDVYLVNLPKIVEFE